MSKESSPDNLLIDDDFIITPPLPIPSLNSSPLSPSRAAILTDDRAIVALIEQLLHRSGLKDSELARRMGIKQQSLSQYKYGFRHNPSVKWLVRLAEACGARIVVEWPTI